VERNILTSQARVLKELDTLFTQIEVNYPQALDLYQMSDGLGRRLASADPYVLETTRDFEDWESLLQQRLELNRDGHAESSRSYVD
jgi:hypothetical protein